MTKLYIYDTTLRDGTQREGISLSLSDKLKITRRLDQFGVAYIEGGWPGSNPKDAEYFDEVNKMELAHAKVAAFGSTRRKETKPEDDANLQALISAETPVVTIFGKSWDLHVRDVLGTDNEENLAMIGESVAFMKQHGREVIYDAEHFFDGYKANPEYAMLTLKVAAENGADCIVLCDTNGGCLPWEVARIVSAVVQQIDAPIGIHTHDDSGCGVANALAAVDAGAIHVQGTINGYGERVGNANLSTIVPDLQIKMGYDLVSEEQLSTIGDLSHYVSEIANLPPETHAPFIGSSAFAHKGGVHVAAMRKNGKSYQHIDPELVGNNQRTVISELSGRGNVLDKAAEFGLTVDTHEARAALEQIKRLEAQGFAFEAAEASMAILLRRMKADYVAPFELVDFTTLNINRDGKRGAEASVKVQIDEELIHTASAGNGPVNALSLALRKALFTRWPHLSDVHLTDYKVRILDGENGTAAQVRVLIDFVNDADDSHWSTVGAHENIIEASWRALTDSYEYALMQTDQ